MENKTNGTDPLERELDELATLAADREAHSSAEPAEVKLSDGRIALVRHAKGRDLEKGAAVAKNAANPLSLFMGVVAQVTRINGAPLIYEELLELPMGDVMALIGAVGGNVPGVSLPSETSS